MEQASPGSTIRFAGAVGASTAFVIDVAEETRSRSGPLSEVIRRFSVSKVL